MIQQEWYCRVILTGKKNEFRKTCYTKKRELTALGSFHMCTKSTVGSASITKLKKPAKRVDHHWNCSATVDPFKALGVPAVGRHCSASQCGVQEPSGFLRNINGLTPAFSSHLSERSLYSFEVLYMASAEPDLSHISSSDVFNDTLLPWGKTYPNISPSPTVSMLF